MYCSISNNSSGMSFGWLTLKCLKKCSFNFSGSHLLVFLIDLKDESLFFIKRNNSSVSRRVALLLISHEEFYCSWSISHAFWFLICMYRIIYIPLICYLAIHESVYHLWNSLLHTIRYDLVFTSFRFSGRISSAVLEMASIRFCVRFGNGINKVLCSCWCVSIFHFHYTFLLCHWNAFKT